MSLLLQFNKSITVTILNEQLTEERVFYASLVPTALGGQVEGGDATVIITPQGRRSQLLPLYIQTLEPFTSIEQLERWVWVWVCLMVWAYEAAVISSTNLLNSPIISCRSLPNQNCCWPVECTAPSQHCHSHT